jgi:hypothetical protein
VDSEDAREHGNHASRLAPEKMISGLHLHFLDRAHLNRTADLKDRTVLRKFSGVSQVFGLGEGAVGDDFLFAGDHLTSMLQRVAGIFNVSLRAEVLKPGDPFFHGFLHLLGGREYFSAAKQVREFTHDVSP